MFTEPFSYTKDKYHLSLQFTGTTNTYKYLDQKEQHTQLFDFEMAQIQPVLFMYTIYKSH